MRSGSIGKLPACNVKVNVNVNVGAVPTGIDTSSDAMVVSNGGVVTSKTWTGHSFSPDDNGNRANLASTLAGDGKSGTTVWVEVSQNARSSSSRASTRYSSGRRARRCRTSPSRLSPRQRSPESRSCASCSRSSTARRATSSSMPCAAATRTSSSLSSSASASSTASRSNARRTTSKARPTTTAAASGSSVRRASLVAPSPCRPRCRQMRCTRCSGPRPHRRSLRLRRRLLLPPFIHLHPTLSFTGWKAAARDELVRVVVQTLGDASQPSSSPSRGAK